MLKLDPDFEALPPTVPHRIRRLVTRCLQKRRKQRLHHIADARIILEETLAGLPDELASNVLAAQKPRTTERLGWLAALALIVIVSAIIVYNLAPRPSRARSAGSTLRWMASIPTILI